MGNTQRRTAMLAVVGTIFILSIVFGILLYVAYPAVISEMLELNFRFLLLLAGIFLSMIATLPIFWVILGLYVQKIHDLSPDDASEMVRNIMIGLEDRPPLHPLWRIQEGRPTPDGPEILQKVGGPGFLSIGHDSAVVTARFGKLSRVLGPGFHGLEPFEKLWDVVDLRPQRRTVTVEMMTRDGIPVVCDAEIRFRIDNGDEQPTESVPFPFKKEAVFKAVTIKRNKGGGVTQDWCARISGGALDAEIRDQLETYRLDDFLTQDQSGALLIARLEKDIFAELVKAGADLGIKVEQVQLGPVRAKEDAISRQWLEAWQSRWKRISETARIESAATQLEMVELARLQAKVNLMNSMLPTIQKMVNDGKELDPRLVMLRFWEVMEATAEREPLVRHLMFQQGESLQRILQSTLAMPAPDAQAHVLSDTQHNPRT